MATVDNGLAEVCALREKSKKYPSPEFFLKCASFLHYFVSINGVLQENLNGSLIENQLGDDLILCLWS